MIQFKDYILLTEWTRELMPEIYAALEKYDDPMVGVHFTKGIPERFGEKKRVPHIGLNLHPFHQDPIGIYTFPKNYVLSGKLEKNPSFREFKNYYIIKPSPNAKILNLSKMTYDEARKVLVDMGIDTPNTEESILDSKEIYHSGGDSVGHKFWGALENVRKKLKIKHRNVSWNALFKDSGYNTLYDEGNGIIHSNEPTQIIYLNSSAMEILDQGKQDDPRNKIYSFFIKQFPELRPQKTKNHWGAKILKLISDKGYDLIITLSSESLDEYSKLKVSIRNQKFGETKPLDEINVGENLEEFVLNLKEKISKVENDYEKESEPPVPLVLKGISKRFNIKLKKMKTGDWEIRQKYQDADKDYVITFYIRTYKDDIFFILEKKQQGAGYNTFGYKENATVVNRERYSPEDIVKSGLEVLENQRYGSISINHSAMKTIEFLRKRVFGL